MFAGDKGTRISILGKRKGRGDMARAECSASTYVRTQSVVRQGKAMYCKVM